MQLICDVDSTADITRLIQHGNVVLLREFISLDICIQALDEIESNDLPIIPKPIYQRGLSFSSVFEGGGFPIRYLRFYGGAHSGCLRNIYQRMRKLARPIRDQLAGDDGYGEAIYHLEIFSYDPHALFARHNHDLRPQMIGLILLLSEQNKGGVSFHVGEQTLHTSDILAQGDLLIFPWDMDHEVTPAVDRARTVALLPYY